MPELPGIHDAAHLSRRSSDRIPSGVAAQGVTGDAEQLLQALRSGAVTIDAIAARLPLAAVFAWYAEGKISESEFFTVVAEQEIHEVELTEAPLARDAATEEAQRQKLAIEGFNARIQALGVQLAVDAVTETHLNAVLQASTPLPEGVGVRMLFARADDGDGRAPAGAPPGLIVTCRAYIGTRSMEQVVKCEAVISGPVMPVERCLRIALPLPVFRGGRRRLSNTVRDLQTMRPLELPPEASELFHERYMVGLELMSKTPLPTGGLGSVVKGALGGLFGR